MAQNSAQDTTELRYCDYYGHMTYADFLVFAANPTASHAISERQTV